MQPDLLRSSGRAARCDRLHLRQHRATEGLSEAVAQRVTAAPRATRLRCAGVWRVECTADTIPWIVATVPPQHMYGMETRASCCRCMAAWPCMRAAPLFPADIAPALDEVARAARAGQHAAAFAHARRIRAAVSADGTDHFRDGAARWRAGAAVEAQLGGQLLEMFGSTETCVIACAAHGRTDDAWHTVRPASSCSRARDGTLGQRTVVRRTPILLQDFVELRGERPVHRARPQQRHDRSRRQARLARRPHAATARDRGVRDAVVFQPTAAIRRDDSASRRAGRRARLHCAADSRAAGCRRRSRLSCRARC